LYKALIDIATANPSARIGVEQSVSEQVEVRTKKYCSVCGFFVVADGHVDRCRVPVVRDPGAELIGDAVHAMDVKVCLVRAMPSGTKYTEMAKSFLSASAQKAYLQGVEPEACLQSSSERTWSTAFEVSYCGDFRLSYLEWLVSQVLAVDGCSWGGTELGLLEEVLFSSVPLLGVTRVMWAKPEVGRSLKLKWCYQSCERSVSLGSEPIRGGQVWLHGFRRWFGFGSSC